MLAAATAAFRTRVPRPTTRAHAQLWMDAFAFYLVAHTSFPTLATAVKVPRRRFYFMEVRPMRAMALAGRSPHPPRQ